MEKTLDTIYRRLIRLQSETLSAGLRNGKTGLLLFMALYSEWKNHGRARNVSARLLAEVTQEAYTLPARLMDGSWGILWTLLRLCDKGILETDDAIRRILHQLTFSCRSSTMVMPVNYQTEDGILAEGIATFSQWSDEESVERYSTAERLIRIVDDCERLLTMDIPSIHSPKDMPLSLLHSIVWYLQEMVRAKLYPYRAEQLLAQAAELYPLLQDTDSSDRYILTSLMLETTTGFPKETDHGTLCHILGKIGFYSLLYNRPKLFSQYWQYLRSEHPSFFVQLREIIKKDSLPLHTLLGMGYGILQCKMNTYG